MSESNKFTPGPWNNMPKTEYVPICKQDEAGLALGFINSTNLERVAEGKANAYLIAAAPDLLEALEKMIDNEEQIEFESWLEMKSPSGDCESVADQWKESSYYLDFIDSVNLQITAINKARGQQ